MTPEEFKRKLEAAIKKTKESSVMKDIGAEMARRIKTRTRLGFGVAEKGGDRQKLLPLSDRYKLLRGKSKLSGDTSTGKSNLTFTGQLLDSIQVKEVGDGFVKVGPKGKREDENLSNEKLAEHVSDAGRPFNTLSKPEIKGLIKFINDLLSGILKL